jgi:hypothetical protein
MSHLTIVPPAIKRAPSAPPAGPHAGDSHELSSQAWLCVVDGFTRAVKTLAPDHPQHHYFAAGLRDARAAAGLPAVAEAAKYEFDDTLPSRPRHGA